MLRVRLHQSGGVVHALILRHDDIWEIQRMYPIRLPL